LLDHQNNYVGNSSISNAAKNFYILAISLNVLHNYFDSSIKLFSDLYLVKFLEQNHSSACNIFISTITFYYTNYE